MGKRRRYNRLLAACRALGVSTHDPLDLSGPGEGKGHTCASLSPYGASAHRASVPATEQKKVVTCGRQAENVRKAKKIVKLLAVDQSMKVVKTPRGPKRLPKGIECGRLRTVVRQMYAPGLSPVQELSIKTTMKAERDPCSVCAVRYGEQLMAYEKARLSSQVVNPDHLQRFGEAFSRNVPAGWNKRKSPYIPNGHATARWGRSEGGNWNEEAFSRECGIKLVWSSGKPRVVTLYSSRNVEVLTPLHNSLYSFLKGRNWLLVGSPTDERLRYLGAGCAGNLWHSFDYESATDNIKTMYVQRMVETLIDKGEGLSSEEIDCLRVLSELRLGDAVACSGQPMGSPMSFPLLCLINKTVLDMALTDLLIEGKISFNEWTSHRCLINGDDLLTRSTSGGDLVRAVARNGAEAGLVVNKEKTMTDPYWAEINSTAFYGTAETITVSKKTNVSALWMSAEVSDVIGFACESTLTAKGLGVVVAANVSRLARQKIKTFSRPGPVVLSSLLRNRRIREALTSRPDSSVPEAPNPFAMVAQPYGFRLSRADVFDAVTGEVAKVRRSGCWKETPAILRKSKRDRKLIRPVQVGRPDRKSALLVLQRNIPRSEPQVMRVLADRWQRQRKEEILAAEIGAPVPYLADTVVFDGESNSCITQITSWIKEYKGKYARSKPRPPGGLPGSFISVDECGEVRFCE